MVWHRDPPVRRYWEWVSQARHAVLAVTRAPPLEPGVEICIEARQWRTYLARCPTHKCLGHPNKVPLYMALHGPDAVPSELDPR